MGARIAADAVVALHLAFIAFVVGGGVLVARWPRLAALHLPAVAWGAYTEFTSTVCPLTPLENALRRTAGDAGYGGSFVEHYLVPIVYPPGLTPAMQVAIGVAVVAVNAALYLRAWRRHRRERPGPRRDTGSGKAGAPAIF